MLENFDLMNLLLSMAVSMVLGLVIAVTYAFKNEYKRDFVIQLAVLPSIVMAIIAIVNGNVGTGVAVMGAFSLVRFRSIPGKTKEIVFIFFAMSVGLATGMDYIEYAVVFTVILCLEYLLLNRMVFKNNVEQKRELKITIPESMDYKGIFDDIFTSYTTESKLVRVRTTNLGTLFQLTYEIIFQKDISEKEMIDKIRQRNGNLDVICGFVNERTDIL